MNKYRDELVERIKLAGHELIDRAESMVSPELNAISDFNISIYFNQDELVERIKLAGHELIDRAESMVSPELNAISDFNISIYFNQGEIQTIGFHTEVINRKELEWRINKEYAKTKKPIENQD